MSALARALLDDLDPEDLAALAQRLAPYLPTTLPPATPAVYSPATLAAELGITARAVRAAIERGDLAARRSGRGYVIGAEAVAAWASSSPTRRRRPRRPAPHRTLRDALSELDDRRGV
jgi:excisionase family DNA binding protein